MLLRIVNLFHRVDTALDYGFLVFGQFRQFLCPPDFVHPRYADLVFVFLKLCIRRDVIFYPHQAERRKFLNHFFETHTSALLADPTAAKMRCQKILFRIRVLEPSLVMVPDMWALILAEMVARQDSGGKREQAWRAFRNAVLNQPRLVSFLVSHADLAKKLGECFSSLDPDVASCMLRTIPSLARPMTTVGAAVEFQNLIDLWTKLADPSVLIAGKIRSAFKAIMNKATPSAVRRAIVDLVVCLWDAPKPAFRKTGGPALETFISRSHILSELTEVLHEVGKIVGHANL
jgi:hypothetical protein